MLRWGLFTVGHSSRTLPELVALLDEHGVELVVDVRRFPVSRKYPHFRRESVAEALAEKGIEYRWLGDLLGGFRSGGYQHYMGSEAFRRGLELLLQLASQRKAAVMCAERLFFRCHRRFIADACRSMGWDVLHIVDPGRVSRHKSHPSQAQLAIELRP
jgi:uncharacterized protein (DUF488 family)